MDRMNPLDASFLHLENDVNHLHIGSVAIFEGPAPAYDDLCGMIAGKLHLTPRYRQRFREVPLQLARPVWVDDEHFNIAYHIRHTALPSPGGREQLRNLTGRLMGQKMDLSKPLWEMWLVEGLEDDHWALLSKVHHALVDGVAGTDLLALILDVTPETRQPQPDSWRPKPPPSSVRLVGEAITDLVASPYEQWRAARAVTRAPRAVLQTAAATVKGAVSMLGVVRPMPDTSLIGDIGPHRRYAWARASLDEVRAIRRALGGTVNDVVLAAITRGFRDLVLARGEDPAEQRIRTLVPVSVRRPDERGDYNNRVSAMFAELPVDLEDPAQRLEAIREQMDELKGTGQAVAAQTLTSLTGFAPPLLAALGTRVAFRAARRTHAGVCTVTTNVPGPQVPLYALGRRMVEACPFVPIAEPMRTGVAIFSYEGKLTFGVTADFDTVPDIDVLADGIEDGMAELLKVAEATG